MCSIITNLDLTTSQRLVIHVFFSPYYYHITVVKTQDGPAPADERSPRPRTRSVHGVRERCFAMPSSCQLSSAQLRAFSIFIFLAQPAARRRRTHCRAAPHPRAPHPDAPTTRLSTPHPTGRHPLSLFQSHTQLWSKTLPRTCSTCSYEILSLSVFSLQPRLQRRSIRTIRTRSQLLPA